MPHTLDWINAQLPAMKQTLIEWAGHNSHSQNLAGLDWMIQQVGSRLTALGAEVLRVDLPPVKVIDDTGREVEMSVGPALLARKRADSPRRVLLNIHVDTVYPLDHPFQQVRELDANTLNGPGVADAKGGLVVLLTALEALERSDFAPHLGWEVLINPDEEIGSPSSAALLVECARRNHFGLLFEPASPDGTLVGERKGSGNFTFIVRGKAAHAGKDFSAGRNAVVAMAELVRELHHTNKCIPGTTFNVGRIVGGGAANIVPDFCLCTLNIRAVKPEDLDLIDWYVNRAVGIVRRMDGISVEMHGGFHAPPKILDDGAKQLMETILAAGREIGLELSHAPSGGASDGNKLAAVGLPVVDSLGPRGGKLHSDEEFVYVDSLAERAKLAYLTLKKIAG